MNFSNPQEVVRAIGVNDASIVVDFGCGSGHYSLACARVIGTQGRVYAIDVQKSLLEKLSLTAGEQSLSNIEILWADIEDKSTLILKEELADLVLVCNVLFQVGDKRAVLENACMLAHTNARVVIVEWSDSHNGLGPDENLIVSKEACIELINETEGMTLERDLEAGDHHYGLVLRKQ